MILIYWAHMLTFAELSVLSHSLWRSYREVLLGMFVYVIFSGSHLEYMMLECEGVRQNIILVFFCWACYVSIKHKLSITVFCFVNFWITLLLSIYCIFNQKHVLPISTLLLEFFPDKQYLNKHAWYLILQFQICI